MKGIEVARLLRGQLQRATSIKAVLLPTPLKEPGPHIKVAVRKVIVPKILRAAPSFQNEIRLYVSLEGTAESETGLEMAVDACETLASYLRSELHLEDADGKPIANTRITATVNDDDGILGDPDNENVAWIDDLYHVTVAYPAG